MVHAGQQNEKAPCPFWTERLLACLEVRSEVGAGADEQGPADAAYRIGRAGKVGLLVGQIVNTCCQREILLHFERGCQIMHPIFRRKARIAKFGSNALDLDCRCTAANSSA